MMENGRVTVGEKLGKWPLSKEVPNETEIDRFIPKKREATVLLLSTFIMSFTVLGSEISLTRMFSVMFAYHYAFLAVAIAFAGLGLGGVFAQLVFPNASGKGLPSGLAIICAAFALLLSLFTVIAASSPSPNFAGISFLFFISFLPAGLFLATVYRSLAGHSNILYAADIVGASVGSIAPVTFFNGLNPVVTMLLLSGLLAISSISLGLVSQNRKRVLGAAIISLLVVSSTLFLAVSTGKDVPLGSDQGKELYALLNDPSKGARIVESRWSAFGRTDLVEFQNSSHTKVIFIDGGAGTQLYHFNGDFNDMNSTVYYLRYSSAAFPLYFANNDNALIVGPGGGVDVLDALTFNFSHIHAVEINAETVNLVKEYSEYDGGIYTNYTNVHVHVDEGRSFLKRANMKYDVIMFDIPVTKTIQGSSGYSMAENYLFTTDSFRDFIDNLKEDGYLIIVAHEDVEIAKLVTTAIEALRSEGKSVEQSMKQIALAQGMHHPASPVFILKKVPFTPGEVDKMLEKSVELHLTPIYFPFVNSTVQQQLEPIFVALADGKLRLDSLIARASSTGADIGPVADDRPFFYKFENGLPFTLPQLLTGFVVLAAVITTAYFLAWGRRIYLATKKTKQKTREVLDGKFSAFSPYYFASLGLGFMLIEVAFVQKFILFLGPPTIAISAVLFSLLLSMGLGGFVSNRWTKTTDLVPRICLLVGVTMVAYIFALPIIFNSSLGLDLSIRLVLTFALTFPIGFLLGIPFPTGIRIVSESFDNRDVVWMWGINSVYSLLGSTLAVIIAMLYGFSIALLVGGTIYFTIFLVRRRFFRS